jgi:WD40 repeat protein
MHILYGHKAPVTSVDISIELDMIVSGSTDGTVNIHTIYKGYYVRTLVFQNDSILRFTHLSVKLNNERYILIYTRGISLNAIKKESNESNQVLIVFRFRIIFSKFLLSNF